MPRCINVIRSILIALDIVFIFINFVCAMIWIKTSQKNDQSSKCMALIICMILKHVLLLCVICIQIALSFRTSRVKCLICFTFIMYMTLMFSIIADLVIASEGGTDSICEPEVSNIKIWYYAALFYVMFRGATVSQFMNPDDETVAPLQQITLEQSPGTSCAICLDDFNRGDNVKRFACSHIFHTPCIDRWILTNLSCPVCRFVPR